MPFRLFFLRQERTFCHFFLVFVLKFSSKGKAIGLGKMTIFDDIFFHKNTYLNKVVASKGHLDCFSCAKKGLSAIFFLFLSE